MTITITAGGILRIFAVWMAVGAVWWPILMFEASRGISTLRQMGNVIRWRPWEIPIMIALWPLALWEAASTARKSAHRARRRLDYAAEVERFRTRAEGDR